VDVVVAVGANEESASVVEPGEAALDDPAVCAEAGSVFGLASGDHRLDAAPPDEATVLVVVVAAVGDDAIGLAPRPPNSASDRGHPLEQRDQLRDVVAVAAGQ